MKILTDNQMRPCTGYHASASEVRFYLIGDAPAQLGERVTLTADDGFELASYRVADYLRSYTSGSALVLTNLPEPVPAPAPPAPIPSVEEDLLTMVLDQDIRISQMELGVI